MYWSLWSIICGRKVRNWKQGTWWYKYLSSLPYDMKYRHTVEYLLLLHPITVQRTITRPSLRKIYKWITNTLIIPLFMLTGVNHLNYYAYWTTREVRMPHILILSPWIYGFYNTATFRKMRYSLQKRNYPQGTDG